MGIYPECTPPEIRKCVHASSLTAELSVLAKHWGLPACHPGLSDCGLNWEQSHGGGLGSSQEQWELPAVQASQIVG